MPTQMSRLTTDEFEKFSELIDELAGIYLAPEKITLLGNRLRRRLRELKIETFGEYHAKFSDPGFVEEELPFFLSAITTNETYFFRNERLWETIQQRLLPEFLANHERTNRTIKIWSAAASSGEEAYTLAIVLREAIKPFNAWKVNIVASDISKKVLDAAKQGRYGEYAVAKMPPKLKSRWFTPVDDKFQVKDEIRKMVRFTHHNLRDPFPLGGFDLVLLRNVLMYFDTAMKVRVLHVTSSAVAPGGYLFIGDVDPIRSSPALVKAMPLKPETPGLYSKPFSKKSLSPTT